MSYHVYLKKIKQEWFTSIYEREYGRSFLSRSIADWDTEKNIIRKYMIENKNTNSVHSAEILCDAILELHEFEKAQNILESMEELILNEPEILKQYTIAITHMIDIAEYKEQRRFCLEKIERLTEAEIILKEDCASSNTYSNIALIFYKMGVYKRALNYYQNALTINEKVLGLDHPSTATTYNNIAGVYQDMGDYDNALDFYQKALAIKEKVLGLDHPSTATSYNNIAGVYKDMGDYDTALKFYQKDLIISEKVLGLDHPSTATTYNNIALVYKAMGDYDNALEFYQKALAIKEKVLGLDHPYTAISYNNIALVYQAMGDYDTALDFYQKAHSIFKEKLGKDHTYTNTTAKMIEKTKQKLQNSSTT